VQDHLGRRHRRALDRRHDRCGSGSYGENVVVNKPLTLMGAQASIDPTKAGARTDPANESILNGNFAIEASDVTINGFTVQNAKTATGITDASGDDYTLLEDNIIQNTALGVSFVGDSNATVTTNRIENAAGDGIDLGEESGDLVESNLIESNGFTTANGQVSQGQGSS
jgi:nitrous oxidase accessory protein NosD